MFSHGTKKLSKVAAVFLLTAIMLTSCGPFKAPTEAAKTFLTELKTDPSAAYEHTGFLFKDNTSEEQFTAFLSSNTKLTQVADSKFNSFNIDNNVATITGTLTFDDGSTSPVQFIVVKDENGWGVGGINLNPTQ